MTVKNSYSGLSSSLASASSYLTLAYTTNIGEHTQGRLISWKGLRQLPAFYPMLKSGMTLSRLAEAAGNGTKIAQWQLR